MHDDEENYVQAAWHRSCVGCPLWWEIKPPRIERIERIGVTLGGIQSIVSIPILEYAQYLRVLVQQPPFEVADLSHT